MIMDEVTLRRQYRSFQIAIEQLLDFVFILRNTRLSTLSSLQLFQVLPVRIMLEKSSCSERFENYVIDAKMKF